MNILLAVCGSISAYKSYDLLRSYLKEGHQVRVILTKGASEFVQLQVFSYLGAQESYVYNDDFKFEKKMENPVLHIDLVKWMDRMVVAPISANTLAKVASGVSDDLLTSCILANESKDIFLYPAMNTAMLNNPFAKGNIKKISKISYIHVGKTDSGLLACGDNGEGKLLNILNIKNETLYTFALTESKKVLISTGPTISPLDPVRFLTNPASGKTGIELAKLYLTKGYEVVLVCGYGMQESIEPLKGISSLKAIEAQTTSEMLEVVQKYFAECDIYISTAAISDIEFDFNETKLKKENMNLVLPYKQSADILKTVVKSKKEQIVVGFAAETDITDDKLQKKMDSKSMSFIVGNIVNNGTKSKRIGFGEDMNTYYFKNNMHPMEKIRLTKVDLAREIYNRVLKL